MKQSYSGINIRSNKVRKGFTVSPSWSDDQAVNVESSLRRNRCRRVGGVGSPELGEKGEVGMVLPPPVHGVLLGAAGALEEPGELQVDLVLQGEHSGRLGATACGQELSPAKQSCVRRTLVLHCT